MSPSSLTALASRLQRHDIPFGDGHVTWRCLGDGPPLVLIHGGHGAWAHWARNVDALSHHATVCLVDLPGYGDSSPPAAPTFSALLEATRHTLDALLGPRTPIALAGFSFGGLVAAALAAQRGDIRRLALLGPAGHGSVRRPRGELRSWREARATGDEATLRAIMRHNLEMHMLAGPADDTALLIHTQACLRTRFHSKTISRAGGLRDHLRALPCPLLLAWGEHDVTCTPVLLAETLARERPASLPAIDTLTVPGAGHWVQYEAAHAINARLVSWLNGMP